MSSKIIIEKNEETESQEYIIAERLFCEREIEIYNEARKTLQEKRAEFYKQWINKKRGLKNIS